MGGFFSANFPENSQIDHPAENGHIFENTSSLGCLILPHCAAWFQPEFEIGLENQKARLGYSVFALTRLKFFALLLC